MTGGAAAAMFAVWALLLLGILLVLAYRRVGLATATLVLGALLAAYCAASGAPPG